MNVKTSASIILAALFLISCSNDTSSIGDSVMPVSDELTVFSGTYPAVSRSIAIDTPLLTKSAKCYLGRYTDPETGTFTDAGFITEHLCVEGFIFPDSVLGLDQFRFSDEIMQQVENSRYYSACLRLYFTELFGDSTNSFKIEVWPLVQKLDHGTKYYYDFDPSTLIDTSSKPMVSVTVSPTNFVVNDSIRRKTQNYYNNIYIPLPDDFAKYILETYYAEGGKEKFADTPAFIDNVCKGFYIKCVQGDGTIVTVDKTSLDVYFKHLMKSYSGTDSLASSYTSFIGNEEVLQVSCFKTTGLDGLLSKTDETFLKTPYGILTEVTLPIDSIINNASTVNSASVLFKRKNPAQQPFIVRASETIVLLRKKDLSSFFDKVSNVNNITSFAATLNASMNEYSFTNISPLIMTSANDRRKWIEEQGLIDDLEGHAAYAAEFPDWDKIVLVPVVAQTDATNNVLYYDLNQSVSCARLKGGPDGDPIEIKVIKSK